MEKKEPYAECHQCGEPLQDEADNYGTTEDECCMCKECKGIKTDTQNEESIARWKDIDDTFRKIKNTKIKQLKYFLTQQEVIKLNFLRKYIAMSSELEDLSSCGYSWQRKKDVKEMLIKNLDDAEGCLRCLREWKVID